MAGGLYQDIVSPLWNELQKNKEESQLLESPQTSTERTVDRTNEPDNEKPAEPESGPVLSATILAEKELPSNTMFGDGWRESVRINLHGCQGAESCKIRTLDFGGSNSQLAAGTDSGQLFLLDIDTQETLFAKKIHERRVDDIDFSQKHGLVATGSADRSASVWDIKKNLETHRLSGHGTGALGLTSVRSVSLNHDASMLITGNGNSSVRLWDLTTGGEINKPLRWGQSEISAVDFHPSGEKFIVTDLQDGHARIVNTETAAIELFDETSKSWLRGGSFIGDGAKYAKFGNSRVATIHSTDSGEEQFRLNGHENVIDQLSANADGSILATMSEGVGSVRVWRGSDGLELVRIDHCKPTAISLSGNGDLFAIACDDGAISILKIGSPASPPAGERWDIEHRIEPPCLSFWSANYECRIEGAKISADGKFLSMVVRDGVASVWSTDTGKLVSTFERPNVVRGETRGYVKVAAISQDSKWLITGGAPSQEDELAIWALDSGEIKSTHLKDLRSFNVQGALFSRDSKYVIAYSTNSRIHVFDLDTGDKVADWEAHKGQLEDYALHPNDNKFITVGYRGHVRVWDYLTGELLNELIDNSLPDETINAIDVSKDGRELISAHKGGRVNIWNLTNNTRALSFDLHRSSVTEAKLASELELAVTGDFAIKVWNTTNGQEIFEVRNSFLLSVSPDGSRFLARTNASNAHSIDMYSVSEGIKIATLYGHKGMLIDAGFLPNNAGIWSTSRDGTAIVWKRVADEF